MGIFDSLAQGPGNLQPQDYQEWNQMVGGAPPAQFGQAAANAIQQIDPQEYYQHSQPGAGGTDPFGALQPQQRSDVAGSLLGSLFNRGLGQQQTAQRYAVFGMNRRRRGEQQGGKPGLAPGHALVPA